MKTLSLADRLIVGLNFDPSSCQTRQATEKYVLDFVERIRITGVTLKVETLARDQGYGLVSIIHDYGLKVFLDAKLYGTKNTLEQEGTVINRHNPEFLTVACANGIVGMRALKLKLPDTKVLGVSVLTSDKTTDLDETSDLVMSDSLLAAEAGLDGMISSAIHISLIKSVVRRKISFFCPAIRPAEVVVPGDDQNPNKVVTPAEAILSGAEGIIVSRPITGSTDPVGMIRRILGEIAQAVEEREKIRARR